MTKEEAYKHLVHAMNRSEQAYLATGKLVRILELKGILSNDDVMEMLTVMQGTHEELMRALLVLVQPNRSEPERSEPN